jgi:hypothetical protein
MKKNCSGYAEYSLRPHILMLYCLSVTDNFSYQYG